MFVELDQKIIFPSSMGPAPSLLSPEYAAPTELYKLYRFYSLQTCRSAGAKN